MRARRPLVSRFRINRLHGYKDVEVSFEAAARIVIAENGSGKTTILSALRAFLDSNYEKLERFQFESIECDIRGISETLVLKKSMLSQSSNPLVQDQIVSLASFANSDVRSMRQLIMDLPSTRLSDLQDHEILRDVYFKSPMSWEEIADSIAGIRTTLNEYEPDELKSLSRQVQSALSGVEVLYLPTYRRVELALGRSERNRDSALRRAREIRSVQQRSGSGGKQKRDQSSIQYGLSDVEERLSELFEEVQRRSNIGYRAISANIIDELLAVQFSSVPDQSQQLPDIESLSRFFSRIEGASRAGKDEGVATAMKRLEAIQQLYDSNRIHNQENEILRYFLSKLSRVVDRTRTIESNIGDFVEKVNVYLRQSSDEKHLQYDNVRMKVLVQNLWTGEEIKLDDLSSGEKQVVSLLAHLYLYDRQKFVLIDEPELSLSIDWQKRLLPDLLDSPTCTQLLAITHSPFICDNELDPYTGPLTIVRHPTGGRKE